MNKNILNNKILYYLPFIILFIIVYYIHLNFAIFGDDVWFLDSIKDNLIVYTEYRYFHWTSRNIIEALLRWSVQNFEIWKIINSAIFVGIAIILTKLFNKKKIITGIISSILVLMFMYSSYCALESSGFVSSTVNYLWPLFCVLLNLFLLKYLIENREKTNIKQVIIYIISIISLFIGTNNEQVSIITLAIYMFLFIYLKYKKIEIPKFFYLSIVIIILSTVNALICPGNTVRISYETAERFPAYVNATLTDKMNIGFSNIINRNIVQCDIITLLLFGLIGVYGYLKNKISIKTIICFIPLIISVLFWILVLSGNVQLIDIMNSSITDFGLNPSSLKRLIFCLIIYLTMSLSLLFGLYQLIKFNKYLGINTFILFILGFGSTLMFGFTPSTPSLERMYIIFYFINLILCFSLIINLIKNKDMIK